MSSRKSISSRISIAFTSCIAMLLEQHIFLGHSTTIRLFGAGKTVLTRRTVGYSSDTVSNSVLHKPLDDESARAAHLNLPV